jgi:hypothetical protein
MLSPQLLEVLVRIGEAGRVDSGSSDNALRVIGDGGFMRQLPQTWDQMALSMSDQQIEVLVKGLTLAEREFSVCYAGSVSPVIWLFRVLAERRNDEIGELVDWVRANTRNDYLPFGVRRDFGARSLAELAARQAAYERQRQNQRVADDELRRLKKENEAAIKAQKARGRAGWNLLRAIERGDANAIKRWLLEGADPGFASDDGVTAIELAREKGLDHLFASNPDDRIADH